MGVLLAAITVMQFGAIDIDITPASTDTLVGRLAELGFAEQFVAHDEIGVQIANEVLRREIPERTRVAVLARLAVLEANLNHTKEALAAAEAALRVKPDEPIALAIRAVLTDFEVADDIITAVKQSPNDSFINELYGRYLLQTGSFENARTAFNRAAVCSPISPSIINSYYVELDPRDFLGNAFNDSFRRALGSRLRMERYVPFFARWGQVEYCNTTQLAIGSNEFDIAVRSAILGAAIYPDSKGSAAKALTQACLCEQLATHTVLRCDALRQGDGCPKWAQPARMLAAAQLGIGERATELTEERVSALREECPNLFSEALARLYVANGDDVKALAILDQSISDNPTANLLLFKVCLLSMSNAAAVRDEGKATLLMDAILPRLPQPTYDVYYARAASESASGNFNASIRSLEKARQEYLKAHLLVDRDEPIYRAESDALKSGRPMRFRRAADKSRREVLQRELQGLASDWPFQRENDYTINLCTELLESEGDTVERSRLLARRAKAKANVGDFKSADADASEAIRLRPDHARLYEIRAAIQIALGQDATSDCRAAIARNEGSAAAHAMLGYSIAFPRSDIDQSSDGTKALYEFDLSLRCDAKYEPAHWYRSKVFMKLGQLEQAFAELNACIELNRAPRVHRFIQVYEERAKLAYKLGKVDLALCDAALVLMSDPKNEGMIKLVGDIYKAAQKPWLASLWRRYGSTIAERNCEQ